MEGKGLSCKVAAGWQGSRVANLKFDYTLAKPAIERGMSFKEAAAKFSIPEPTLRSYAAGNNWRVVPLIVRKARAIVKSRGEVASIAAKQISDSWAARGERHRERVMKIAEDSLASVKKVPVKSARDLEMVDKAARRAAGLEVADTVNQTLIQVNEAINQHAGGVADEPIEAELVEENPSDNCQSPLELVG